MDNPVVFVSTFCVVAVFVGTVIAIFGERADNEPVTDFGRLTVVIAVVFFVIYALTALFLLALGE